MQNNNLYNRLPNDYIPQPHNCYHQIERDRLLIQVQQLEADLWRAQGDNQELRYKLMISSVQAVVGKKRKRKPRHRAEKRQKFVTSTQANYKPLSENKKTEKLQELFAKLTQLSDIIDLENQDNLPCLLTNMKFAKLHGIIPVIKELHGLVGLERVKAEVFEMISYYTQLKVNKVSNNGLVHIVLKGPPGVGKTTTARLLGKLVLGLGVLKNDKFIEARRSDLIGEYLGQTAPKTQKVIDSAMGGVLFIDEGSALGHAEKRDSFSKEAIDTLNQNLTEHKGKFLCIVAGYAEELETCFFDVNPGLKRRFKCMEIKDYTPEQLHIIFQQKIADDNWVLKNPEQSLKFFEEKHNYLYFFGGDAESLFNKAKFVAAGRLMRCTLDFATNPELLQSDITTAYEQCFADREGHVSDLSMYI